VTKVVMLSSCAPLAASDGCATPAGEVQIARADRRDALRFCG
jgi:hypothetical protein